MQLKCWIAQIILLLLFFAKQIQVNNVHLQHWSALICMKPKETKMNCNQICRMAEGNAYMLLSVNESVFKKRIRTLLKSMTETYVHFTLVDLGPLLNTRTGAQFLHLV